MPSPQTVAKGKRPKGKQLRSDAVATASQNGTEGKRKQGHASSERPAKEARVQTNDGAGKSDTDTPGMVKNTSAAANVAAATTTMRLTAPDDANEKGPAATQSRRLVWRRPKSM